MEHVDRTVAGPGRAAGTVALVAGLLFLLATAFTGVLSLSASFNPPTWVRAVGLVWLPVGLVVTPAAYVLARGGPGQRHAVTGAVLGLVGVAAFVALLVVAG